MLSDNKPLPEPILNQIYVVIGRLYTTCFYAIGQCVAKTSVAMTMRIKKKQGRFECALFEVLGNNKIRLIAHKDD